MYDTLQKSQRTRIETSVQAGHAKDSPAGRAAMAEAAMILREWDKQPRFMEQALGVSHDAILLERAKKLGLIDEEGGIERVDELLKQYSERKKYLRQSSLPSVQAFP